VKSERSIEFPSARDFWQMHWKFEGKAQKAADQFALTGGKKLPESVENLGSVLSLLYRGACCHWGCRSGDSKEGHQIEWLTGRVVNLALSSYRLVRAAFYDESLMLTRGIGEIANLLWLFNADPAEQEAWVKADKKTRLRVFGPASVRDRLKSVPPMGAPISADRYSQLCEIGTHPVPGFAPGHYSGRGRPVLGVLLQPVGVFVSVTELNYAVATCAVALSKLLDPPNDVAKDLRTKSLSLIRSLGAFTVLNYDELLAEALKARDAGAEQHTAPDVPASAASPLRQGRG
jgi:hypothetical protein